MEYERCLFLYLFIFRPFDLQNEVYILHVLTSQMCSYVVQDYMDDLVDCFESFIQKSLLAIIIALAVIVASVMYLLKILSERTLENSASFGLPIPRDSRGNRGPRANTNTASRESRKTKKNYIQNDSQQVAMAHSVPSYEDSVLKMVGLSCCAKPCCKSKTKVDGADSNTEVQLSNTKYGSSPIIKQEMEYEMRPSRATIPQMPKEIKREKSTRNSSPIRSPSPKHSIESLTVCPRAIDRSSCCSMCCQKEK